jgi:UPF0716 protein FxsA
MPLILFLLIAVPIFEVFFLLQVGDLIGLVPTVAGIVLTGVVGAALARREGLKVWRQVSAEMSRGALPDRGLLAGLLIFGGGLLLLTPGFFTDALGFAMILPPTRSLLARVIRTQLKKRVQFSAMPPMSPLPFGAPSGSQGSNVVDGEIKH